MKKIVYLILIALVACTSKPASNVDNERSDIDTNGSADSLTIWTAESIKESNMPLVLLMDTLYRFVRSDEFLSNSFKENTLWMNKYREQLCYYYDRFYPGEDSISSYSKADSVIQSADQLWELDTDESTMGMIINNDVERTRLVFRHYNKLSSLLSICETQEQKQILEEEFKAWEELEGAISEICAHLIDLGYCGGTGAGPVRTSAYIKILDVHVQLLIKEGSWLVGNNHYQTQGVFPDCAKTLLISCCQTAYKNNFNNEYAKHNDYYREIASNTQRAIRDLPPIIDKWLEARQDWESSNGNGWSIDMYNLNTGEVLLKLSNIICQS